MPQQPQRRTKGGQKGYHALVPRQCWPLESMGEVGRDRLRRYFADTPFARDVAEALDKDGYYVCSGVLSAEETEVEHARAWEFVEAVSPGISRDQPTTWFPSYDGGPDPWPHDQREMMQSHHAGWVFSDLRTLVAERVFKPLYGTSRLHVSKEGFTFQRPTIGRPKHPSNDYYGQGCYWLGLQCVQGSIALTDQSSDSGCFQVWPGSHRFRETILDSHRLRNSKEALRDHITTTASERVLLVNNGIKCHRVPVRQGDVILWRSDVVHCWAPPADQCKDHSVVAYVTCTPAEITPEDVYDLKKLAGHLMHTGTHWPNWEEWIETKRDNAFACMPFFRAPPRLTLRQRQLYGLLRYPSLGTSRFEAGEPYEFGKTTCPSRWKATHEAASVSRSYEASEVVDSSALVNSESCAPANSGLAEETCGFRLPSGKTLADASCGFKPRVEPATAGASKNTAIPGLTLATVSQRKALAALAELRPHFERNNRKSSSQMFEVGWSFHSMDESGVMQQARPLADFTRLREVLTDVMLALTGCDDLGEDTLNIICRRYSRGQGLPRHIDRPQLFEEDVYGCVLLNNSDKCLEFQQVSKSGDVLAAPYRIEEQSGSCMQQRGPARYDWLHGVEPLGRGERVSVTWRWIQRAAATEGHRAAASKTGRKVWTDAKAGAGIRRSRNARGYPDNTQEDTAAPCETRAADEPEKVLENASAAPSAVESGLKVTTTVNASDSAAGTTEKSTARRWRLKNKPV
eukprot:TRINITY_DN10734_c0_g2_i2.p1 TRINITY_DN10734_c0_g2~~TRINITY_DN10734_c0_g2_i2.p1  ORF type:complete len:744 (+),score=66.36 TRINITY_DN10734_c0_g2_i2:104-2335(+)